jgi:hypothetical protein
MKALSPIDVIWHDDELTPDREARLAPYRRWFLDQEKAGRLKLRTTKELSELASLLGDAQLPPAHLLVLDVKLTREKATNFDMLGFPRETILKLEAGVQLVALLRNKEFRQDLRPALCRYDQTPVVLLSSSTVVQEAVKIQVNGDKRDNILVVFKSLDNSSSETSVHRAFLEAMDGLLARLATA